MQSDFFGGAAKVLSVAELTRAIRGTLETRFGAVWVQGEISNYKLHPSGHQYFTLKDQRAQIACVIFRNTLPPFTRPLADGAQVQVYGNVSVFEARGQYQLSVQILQPRGVGLLQAKFEALKRKLDAEGLFAAERKRPLPKFPRRIAIVTSPSGAALRDMLNVLQRRAPALEVLISPVRVQGTGAAAEIAVAIREVTQPSEAWAPLDLIVVARGGGSIEDLWEFNEEIVARAISEAAIPVVSAVGHEVDFTIADFVADLRAPTPSAAAELIVPDTTDLLRRIHELSACLDRNFRNFAANARIRLRALSEKALTRDLAARIRNAQQQVDVASDALMRVIEGSLANARAALLLRSGAMHPRNLQREISTCTEKLTQLDRRLAGLPPRLVQYVAERLQRSSAMLRVLGPERTLRRGYSITTNSRGEIVRSMTRVRAGAITTTRVSDGTFEAEVRAVDGAQ